MVRSGNAPLGIVDVFEFGVHHPVVCRPGGCAGPGVRLGGSLHCFTYAH